MIEPFEEFSFADVDNAPPTPGLYAWYGALYVSVADYKRDIDAEGHDLGATRLRSLLARHLGRYQLVPFDVTARGPFGADWRGALEDAGGASAQEIVRGIEPSQDEPEDVRGFAKTLSSVVASERQRALLGKVLGAAAPFMTSPIYIGVTANLRKRLREHTDTYRNLLDAISGDDETLATLRARVRRDGLHFAARAVAMDFQPEHLRVYTMDVGALADKPITNKELREIAGTAEWLLNRWHRPIAGRR